MQLLPSKLKIQTAYNLILKSTDWWKYYLDYLGYFHDIWLFRISDIKLYLRPNSIDKWITAEEFALDIYKLNELTDKYFDSVFDIGAQIGTFSLHAAKVFPNAKVHSFEPDEDSYKVFLKNIKVNALEGRIQPFNTAVSAETSTSIKLFEAPTSAAKSTYVTGTRYKEVVNLNFAKLSEFNLDNALLKIDIEGGEKDIFSQAYLSTLKKFKFILVEYHHFLDTHEIKPFEEFLKQHGFGFKRVDLVYFISNPELL